MNRTKLIWLAFLACAGVMGGAMALVTHHALSLEKARLQSDAEAELGEKERLALWRMDTEAASMLVMENNRPPAEFRAFAKPDNTYDSDYRNFAKGRVLLPSPLLAETPEHSILYFEIDEHGIARSPQVPESGERALALKQGLAKGLLDERAASLARLRGILRSKPDMVSAGGGNIDMVVAAANSSTPEIPAQAVQPAQQNAPDHPNGQMEDMRRQILQQGKDGQQAMPPSGNVGKEEAARLNEYNSRLAIVQRAVSKKTANGYADSQGLANQAMTDALGGKDQSGGGTQANANSPQAQQTVVSQDPRQNAQPIMQAAWVTTYKPLWLEGELLLVRAVGDGDGRRVQVCGRAKAPWRSHCLPPCAIYCRMPPWRLTNRLSLPITMSRKPKAGPGGLTLGRPANGSRNNLARMSGRCSRWSACRGNWCRGGKPLPLCHRGAPYTYCWWPRGRVWRWQCFGRHVIGWRGYSQRTPRFLRVIGHPRVADAAYHIQALFRDAGG